ncbi:unnamed protein product [Chilo suppressalis]|uniref:Translin n=1 Tax=Chilo suppressalis TaxID=168631 RepID=A0ABN8BC83_CHISP|nr:unnamed protein product [Chilo suppressalis]
MGFLGITKIWVGACGFTSLNATHWSSSYTNFAGISFLRIFPNIVSPPGEADCASSTSPPAIFFLLLFFCSVSNTRAEHLFVVLVKFCDFTKITLITIKGDFHKAIEMGENMKINDIFTKFQKDLDADQERREVIRTICKEIQQISREAVTVLQVIHHKEEGIIQACQKARELFEKTRQGYAKLKEAVPPTDYFKYHDHWRGVTQQYCFLISLVIWLEVGILASHETIAEVLGVSSVEEKEGFHLDVEDYLVGLLFLCSE